MKNMKNMKKQVMAWLCVAALGTLAACGGQPQQPPKDAPPPPAGSQPNMPPPPPHGAPDASAPAKPMKVHKIDGESVTVKTVRGDVTVPVNPERIAVYDFGMLDTLQALGVKAGVTMDNSRMDYLKPAIGKNGGTLFEPNFEVLNEYKPQLIITGSRTAKAFDQLNELAPTIEMTVDTKDMFNNAKERIDAFGKIFKKEAEAEKLKANLDKALADAKAAAQGKGNGLVFIVNGGKLAAQGENSRLGGWLHKDIGVPAVDKDMKEGSHGMPISFEYIKEKNPDWLFVLDRSAAIGEEGQAAKDVLNNPLVTETTAWKKGQVVYLLPGSYLAAGGAQQLTDAAKQITEAFSKAK